MGWKYSLIHIFQGKCPQQYQQLERKYYTLGMQLKKEKFDRIMGHPDCHQNLLHICLSIQSQESRLKPHSPSNMRKLQEYTIESKNSLSPSKQALYYL